MTLVGKKLQDIYDSGAKALVELQEQASKNFEQSGKEHLQSTKQSAQRSSLSLQDKSSHLQNELKDLMQASLIRLENALAAETERNHTFVISLIAELQTNTEQMKSKFAALEQSHHENVDFAFNLASQHYVSNLESAKINLDKITSQHQAGLSGYAQTIADKLLRTIGQDFWQQHEQSAETSDSFFAAAREQEGLVSDRASLLTQTLAVGCQTQLANAKTIADQSNQEIEASIHSSLETIAKHANSVEKDSKERYARLTDNHFQDVDSRLSDFADELSSLHDGITDQLLKNTEELSSDLLSASTQAQEGLRLKCDQAVDSVNSDFAVFKQKLETRLQLSRGQKQTLEEDKNKILIAIKNELLSIHDSFAKKLATLLGNTKSELADMTKSVESKILAAMDTCNEQVGTSATLAQKQIEDEVAAFLQELSDSCTAAVGEITASAHGNLPLVNVPENVEKPESPLDTDLMESPTNLDASDSKTTKRNRRRKSEDIGEQDNMEGNKD